ncbi:hypothetical protein [Nonomuraea fuscirosea]|uniref:hypothetical protein n=1 Tax=Nonomuraea fuscirosea TaxID=1291556 RepID=UPI00341264D6
MQWKESPEYRVTGGEIVAQNLNRPLTCILFTHLCVYALKKAAPTVTVAAHVGLTVGRDADGRLELDDDG